MRLQNWVVTETLKNQHGIDADQSEQTWLARGQTMPRLVGRSKEFGIYCVMVGIHWKGFKKGTTQSDLRFKKTHL